MHTWETSVQQCVRRKARDALALFTFDVPPAEPGVVFGWDTLVLLKHLLDEGLTKTDIAKRLGVSRRVIHH